MRVFSCLLLLAFIPTLPAQEPSYTLGAYPPPGYVVTTPGAPGYVEPETVPVQPEVAEINPDLVDLVPRPTVLIAEYKDQNGVTHTVKSVQQPGESVHVLTMRHRVAVQAMTSAFPPA